MNVLFCDLRTAISHRYLERDFLQVALSGSGAESVRHLKSINTVLRSQSFPHRTDGIFRVEWTNTTGSNVLFRLANYVTQLL